MRCALDFDELILTNTSEYRVKILELCSFSDRSFQLKYEKTVIQMADTYINFRLMYVITDWLFISIIPHLIRKNPNNADEENAN